MHTSLKWSNIHHVTSCYPVPQITVNITSTNGSSYVKVLPDSGVDISASESEMLIYLNEYPNKLIVLDVIPRTVNVTKVFPLGKFPVTLHLSNKGEMYTFTQMSGHSITWKACKTLQIMPLCYPKLILSPRVHEITIISSHYCHSTPYSSEYHLRVPYFFQRIDKKYERKIISHSY